MRRPHYLPHNKANQLPSNCIWFDTETKYKLEDDGYEHHHLWFGWAAYSRRRTDDTWTKPEWFYFTDIPSFWSWVFSKQRPKTRLYLFAHNGAFDLPVMDAFNYLPKAGYDMDFAVVDAPPMIISWKKKEHALKFVDTLNIWRLPLDKIGEQLKIPKLEMPKTKRLNKAWKEYGKQDTLIIMQACMQWFKFLRDYDLGGFAATLASQSLNAYRHRFMDHKLLVHSNEKALELERAAYVGGRTECFKIGKFKGKFYHVDINSMYPYIMQNKDFPINLISVYKRVTKEELLKWAKEGCVIADVNVDTVNNCYPTIHDNRLIFPTGKFNTTLSTPEVIHALEHNDIVKINKVGVYDTAKPFNKFITELYNQRLKAREDDRHVDVWNLKIFMNSLYGKFGQRGRRYEIIDTAPVDEIEVWDEVDLDTKEVASYRKFGGKIQRFVNDGESFHSMPAIAAHVTAYARMMLYESMCLVGKKNVYYVDTDCMVLNQTGFDKLSSVMDSQTLGKWKLEGAYKTIELYSPKDYKFDDVIKIKGIRKNADKIDNNTFRQVKFVGLAGLLRLGNLSAPLTTQVTKKLNRQYLKGEVQPDKSVSPFNLTMF